MELLTFYTGTLVKLEHELYRTAHVYGNTGLTDKERKFMLARQEGLRTEREKLHKLTQRLRKT